MTESAGNEPSGALFARIRKMVEARGADIRVTLSSHALRLEFADGQRILVNVDAHTHDVWLAARSGGTEFIHHSGTWLAPDGSELLSALNGLIEHTIASSPLNARAPEAPASQPPHPAPVVRDAAPERHGLRNFLIVVLAAAFGFWAALQFSNAPAPSAAQAPTTPDQTLSLNTADTQQQCEGGLPANGSVTVFTENGMDAAGPNDPEVTLQNDHAHPLLLILTVPRTAIPAMSVLIRAHQGTRVRVPTGQYDMLFAVGDAWCGPRQGFSDGHILKFDRPLTVQMDRPVQLVMQSSGAGLDEFQVFFKTILPETAVPMPAFAGDGTMEVQRQANGHFYLPATVENIPVTFMVDTGASITSISADIAQQAGIRNCREAQFQTAAGVATGCIALVSHMTLGNFELQNITVAVMPNLETNLLGANVLRNFQVSQSDTTMLIGRR